MDWLKPLLLMFYAPGRGLARVRDRAPLGVAAVLALAAQVALTLYTQWPFLLPAFIHAGAWAAFGVLRAAAGSLFLLAFAFVPVLVLLANWLERRGSFRLVLQQEYAPLASAVFYAWAAAHLAALPLIVLARRSGFEAEVIGQTQQMMTAAATQQNVPPGQLTELLTPAFLAERFAFTVLLPLLAFWTVAALRAVFRVSWARAAGVVAGGGMLMLIVSPLLDRVGNLLASPFLLLLLFFFLRGYLGDLMQTQRARAAFRQNLEAATLNPADASAHYNLGLIQQQRGELAEARQRFLRAVEIDADEVDAHYQLGRISRTEQKLAEAIRHFEQVVVRAPQHSLHEIWREIGATYLAAGQHEDALEALERFLAQRPSDPEGLYLKGRTLAGLGRQREATDAMRACIEAVQTAPAYKYRADKRWLNEAQQFLRTQA